MNLKHGHRGGTKRGKWGMKKAEKLKVINSSGLMIFGFEKHCPFKIFASIITKVTHEQVVCIL